MLDDRDIRLRIKQIIVDRLLLDPVAVEAIADDDFLFNGGLGLDSVDGLELTLWLEQEFGIKIKNKAIKREYFATVATLSAFVGTRISESGLVED